METGVGIESREFRGQKNQPSIPSLLFVCYKVYIIYNRLIHFTSIKTIAWVVFIIHFTERLCFFLLLCCQRFYVLYLRIITFLLESMFYRTEYDYWVSYSVILFMWCHSWYISCVSFCNKFWRREHKKPNKWEKINFWIYKFRLGMGKQFTIGNLEEWQLFQKDALMTLS